jgi:Icc-related predicted phosphoesterase
MKMTRILYGSDFHGSDTVYRKFINAAFQYQANVLIVGGDVTGKGMIPIVNEGNGVYTGYLFGGRTDCRTQDEIDKFKKTISSVGFYPIVLEKDEADHLEHDPSAMSARFEQEMCQRVREWMILAEEKLTPKNIKLFFMPGNDDLFSIDEVISEFPNIKNPDMQRYMIDDEHELVGCSYANMTPWKCVRDLEEPDLKKKNDDLAAMVQDPAKTIAVLHVPPIDSGLDSCPELDKDLKIVAIGGQVLMKAAGAHATREFIEKVQPMLSLHGYIHESPGHKHIGRTLCINAGSEYAESILKAAIINIEGDKVKGHLLISG